MFAYASISKISIKHVPKDDFPLPNIDLLVDKTIVKVCLLYYYYYDLPTIRNYRRRLPRGRVRFVRGAPLGFYGAWPAFALTHHFVIWFVAAQVYPGVPFTRYAILGDDIVIGDERVAERYRELMSQLNLPFSLEKSLVSSVGALEFAKRFFVRGVTKDLSPVSCRMLRSLVSSISLVPVMRAIMSTDLPLSYRLREAGYRVYTRRTAPPGRHWHRHFLVFHSPNGVCPLPFWIWLSATTGKHLTCYQQGMVRGYLIRLLTPRFPRDSVISELFEAWSEYDWLGEAWVLSEWMKSILSYWSWYYTIAEDLNTPIEALLSPPVVPLVTNRTNKLDHFKKYGAVFRCYDLVLSCEEPKALDVGRFGPVCSPQFAPYLRLKQAGWRPRLKITSRQ